MYCIKHEGKKEILRTAGAREGGRGGGLKSISIKEVHVIQKLEKNKPLFALISTEC